MEIDVYCDEAYPDVLMSKAPRVRYMLIGAIFSNSDFRHDIKHRIFELRERHNAWGEIKWAKISPSKVGFYRDLIDLYFDSGDDFRFRCIAVDRHQVNLAFHNNDGELGFYKFYYQLLRHWIEPRKRYTIFCDAKVNRAPSRLKVLADCLKNAEPNALVSSIQSLPSKEVVHIQLCDLLLGAASSRLNNTLNAGSAKETIVAHIESRLRRRIGPTTRNEFKFNLFKIRLREQE